MTPRTPTKYPRHTRPRHTAPKLSAGEFVTFKGKNAVIVSISKQAQLARVVTKGGEINYAPLFALKSKAVPNKGKLMDCSTCRKRSLFVVNSRNYKCAVCKTHHFCASPGPVKELLHCCNTERYISYRLKCTNCSCLTDFMATKFQMDKYAEKLQQVQCAEALIELSQKYVNFPKNITRKYLSNQESRIRSIICKS